MNEKKPENQQANAASSNEKVKKSKPSATKDERLKQALRQNLRRRKTKSDTSDT